jgi:hypothetical protein
MRAVVLEQLDRAGDGAAAGQQGLAQLVNRLLGRVADEQVPQQASGHRWKAVLACVEAADVVGEDQVGIPGHAVDGGDSG